jgi:hypothetical protein
VEGKKYAASKPAAIQLRPYQQTKSVLDPAIMVYGPSPVILMHWEISSGARA